MGYTLVLSFLVLCGHLTAAAQVTSSANLGCTVTSSGGMACNGIGETPKKDCEKNVPKLFVTHFMVEPGAVLDQAENSCCDALIIGINGGDLVNERPPLMYVSLSRDSVTLLPRGEPYLLRNKSSDTVELRLIEIRR